jgi:DNA-binding transcriptional MocR family regulator
MPRFRNTVPIDDYVLDVLMRDLIGHDRQPAAFLVYLHLYREAERQKWKPVSASLRIIAEKTGLSKSAVQVALARLRTRELIRSTSEHATALPQHHVLRHWRQHSDARAKSGRKTKRGQSRSR